MGDVHLELGRFDEALSRFDQALQITQEHDDSFLYGLHDWSMADYYEATGDLIASLSRRQRALDSLQQLGWLVSVIDTQIALGDTALALGDRAQAQAAWHEALRLIGQRRLPQTAQAQTRLARLDQEVELDAARS
ncbi:tetratricopeptide repeat protein [Paractinoplanes brasiliensis]|uniref:tetratricopeptide repeat protein n=1 Tax=Paractinoplanes brasiliensis TaxID=52695 RepID=UPI0034DAFE17